MGNIGLDGRFLAVNVTPNPCPRHVCFMSVTMLMTIAERFRWIECFLLEPVHKTSNNVVCATSKASDQPAHTRSLIRAFASRLSILWLLSYWLNIIWRLGCNLVRVYTCQCQIVGNLMPRLKYLLGKRFRQWRVRACTVFRRWQPKSIKYMSFVTFM